MTMNRNKFNGTQEKPRSKFTSMSNTMTNKSVIVNQNNMNLTINNFVEQSQGNLDYSNTMFVTTPGVGDYKIEKVELVKTKSPVCTIGNYKRFVDLPKG